MKSLAIATLIAFCGLLAVTTGMDTCSSGYIKNVNTGNCERCPGDYSSFILDGRRTTCSEIIGNDPQNCNKNMMKTACCETCAKTKIESTNIKKCSGDYSSFILDGRRTTCSEVVSHNPQYYCNQYVIKTACCQTCAKTKIGSTNNSQSKRDISDRERCPQGDYSSFIIYGRRTTCSEFVSKDPNNCNKNMIKTACCETCAKIGTSSTKGKRDISDEVTTSMGSCQSGYIKNVNTGNCQRCPGDYSSFILDGRRVTCSELVSKDPMSCNKNMLKTACCETCAKTKIGSTNNNKDKRDISHRDPCPQGDYSSFILDGRRTTCSEVIGKNPQNCNKNMMKTACCETCAKTRTIF